MRSRLRHARASLWLDGVIGAVATTAVAAAVAYGPVIHEGSAGDLSAAVLTSLAYPVGDLLLLGMVTAIFGLSGWRPGRAWIALGFGLALNGVADGIYLVQLADGTWVEDGWVNALWPASSLLIGFAAWQPIKRGAAPKVQTIRVVIVPVVCGVVGAGLLAYDHFSRLNGITVVLAGLTLLLVLVRSALVFAENQRVLVHSQAEALTDPLTGLRNRRSLMMDLTDAVAHATPEQPVALVLFDLDGFKEYNDAFGHPAGDGLLVRLGRAAGRHREGPRARLPARRRRVLRGATPGRRGPCRPGERVRGGARRARRGLPGDDLPRHGDRAGRGDRRDRGAAGGRPPHVRAQGRAARLGRAPVARRAAAQPLRAPARPAPAPARHRGPRARCRQRAGHAR